LLEATHPLLDDHFVGGVLADLLAAFTGADLTDLRVNLERLINLHGRSGVEHDDRSRSLLEAAEQLRARLPPADAVAELRVLVRLRALDVDGDQLRRRIEARLASLDEHERLSLVELLTDEMPAAYHLGRALAATEGRAELLLARLSTYFDQNPNALIGYLQGLVEAGDREAFDAFLDGSAAQTLSEQQQLAVAVNGPATDRAVERVMRSVRSLPVRDAASTMFRWGRELDTGAMGDLVSDWSERIEGQDDYNAVVDWVNIALAETAIEPPLEDVVWHLLNQRRALPELGHQAWDWAHLAARFLGTRSSELLELLLDLIEQDSVLLLAGDDESQLIEACLREDPRRGWNNLAERLESAGGWRYQMQLQGWIQNAVPVAIIAEWVGDDVERARTVGSIAHPGQTEPADIARYLLESFDDAQVRSSLRTALRSGSWTGPWSSRISGQIEDLSTWLTNARLSPQVRSWASDTIAQLRREREFATEREEEREY
jgi:hypothetical protein